MDIVLIDLLIPLLSFLSFFFFLCPYFDSLGSLVENTVRYQRIMYCSMSTEKKLILKRQRLPEGVQPWPTEDPWLFAVHHRDEFPPAIANMKPDPKLLQSRTIGNDFTGNGSGWRMYHGSTVPGFPVHPHRGFETISIVINGYVDHHDSLGANGRLGPGDVQWMTAGRGLQHSEMFPLLNTDRPNPSEMFQLWLNLPRASKFVDPYFQVMWNEVVPIVHGSSPRSTVKIIAGAWNEEIEALPPNKDSYATRSDSAIQVFLFDIFPGDHVTIPPFAPEKSDQNDPLRKISRCLYYYSTVKSSQVTLTDLRTKEEYCLTSLEVLHLDCTTPALLHVHQNSNSSAKLLLLQGRAIGEPIARGGPFVMNTQDEVRGAFEEYQATRFGGWPFATTDPVLPVTSQRVAVFPNGSQSTPPLPRTLNTDG